MIYRGLLSAIPLFSIIGLGGCSTATIPGDESIIAVPITDIDDWRAREFAGRTEYSVIELDNRQVLKASSKNSASAILREVVVDLTRTPFLNWRWRVENTYGDAIDEQTKEGDDYPARLYVVAGDGFLPWEVISVNYVWSSNQLIGSKWSNAWTSKSQMLALRSGGADVGEWRSEKRNLREDFKALFDRDVDAIKAIAIMVDSDNAGGAASSYFSDIYFSVE